MNRLVYVGVLNALGIVLGIIFLAITLIAGSITVTVSIGWSLLIWLVFFILGWVMAIIDPLKMDR